MPLRVLVIGKSLRALLCFFPRTLPVLCRRYLRDFPLPKSTPLFFLCEHGWKADEAARKGRSSSFLQAYSLGGTQDLFWD